MINENESNFAQILMGLTQEKSLKPFQRLNDNLDGSVWSMWFYGALCYIT